MIGAQSQPPDTQAHPAGTAPRMCRYHRLARQHSLSVAPVDDQTAIACRRTQGTTDRQLTDLVGLTWTALTCGYLRESEARQRRTSS